VSCGQVTFLAELTDKAALLDRLSDPNAKIITKPVKAEAIHDFLDLTTTRTSNSVIKKRIKPIAVIDKDTASVSNSMYEATDPMELTFRS